jgi:hypothetical protein
MTDIQVSCGQSPHDLAKVIAATLHGIVPTEADEHALEAGRMVRREQEEAELTRSSWNDMPTLNFETLDEDLDWTSV